MDESTTTTSEATISEVLVRADEIEKPHGLNLPLTRSVSVLTGANLKIRAREIVGIGDENGSGKSTVMYQSIRNW
ncbi:hypothetical protein [Halorubrum salsamenti]|jgi:ABC-type sugar transport system ATPase subunit|uniref:hypothetical protein n=1 Tax=Halorubrum salsamenti TaxID=2583990 RepID=UPI0011A4A1DB|nr:hypothetical protein [Halorubrum salsamenti]